MPRRPSAHLAAFALLTGLAGCGSAQPGGSGSEPAPAPRPVVPATIPPPAGAGKVYALVVADAAAEAVVPGFTLDVDATAAAARRLLTGGVGPGRLELVTLRGDAVTPEAVEAAVRKFPVTDRDALVCVFAGHGSYNLSRPDGHVLFLHGGPEPKVLQRSTLRGWLTGRNPRLAVLLTETSAGIMAPVPGPARTGGTAGIEGVPAEVTDDAFPPPADPAAVRPAFRRLLLKTSGLVDLNGADDGTSSWSPTGEPAFFARALLRQLADVRDDDALAWADVYARARAAADRGFRAWRTVELGRIKAAPPPLSSADRRTADALTGLPTIAPRAYHLPGDRLRVVVEPADGRGMRVVEVPLDSPVRAGGVRAGELIVRADGEDVPSADRWQRVVGDRVNGGRTKFTFRVRGADAKERDVVVELPK